MVLKKKQKSPLRSIISEAVPDAAMDEFKENRQFITSDGRYIGLVIDGDEMNLSKKVKFNSDLGQFIHSVNEGMISSYTPASLLDANKFIVIPNPTSLADMGEFSILTKKDYPIAFVNATGEVEEGEGSLNFEELTQISDGQAALSDFLDLNENEESEPETDTDSESDAEPESAAPVSESTPESAPNPEPTAEPAEKTTASEPKLPQPEQAAPVPEPVPEPMPVPEPEPQGQAEAVPVEQESQHPEDQEQDVPMVADPDGASEYTKEFFLNINGENVLYPANYLQERINGNTDYEFQLIPYRTEESPLSDVINQRIAMYNAELANVHHSNLAKADRSYRTLMAEYAQQLMQEFDLNNPEGQFGKRKLALDQQRTEANQKIVKDVQQEKQRLDSNYVANKRAAVNQAISQAEQQFDEQNQPVLQAELKSFERKLETDAARQYEEAKQELQSQANQAFQMNMQISAKAVADTVMSKYEPILEKERIFYQQQYNAFKKDLAEIQKQEQIAIETKAMEEQRNQDLQLMQQKHQAEMEKTRQTFAKEKSELEISKSQAEAKLAHEKEQLEKTYQSQLRTAETRITALETEKQQIADDLTAADERAMVKAEKKARKKVRKENDENIQALKSSINALEEKQKTTRKYFIYGMIGLAILGTIIGLMIGMSMNFNMSRQSSVDQIKEEFYKTLNDKNAEDKQAE